MVCVLSMREIIVFFREQAFVVGGLLLYGIFFHISQIKAWFLFLKKKKSDATYLGSKIGS